MSRFGTTLLCTTLCHCCCNAFNAQYQCTGLAWCHDLYLLRHHRICEPSPHPTPTISLFNFLIAAAGLLQGCVAAACQVHDHNAPRRHNTHCASHRHTRPELWYLNVCTGQGDSCGAGQNKGTAQLWCGTGCAKGTGLSEESHGKTHYRAISVEVCHVDAVLKQC